MAHLRLAAAQLNTVVGDLAGNVERISAPSPRPRRPGPTSASCPSWPSPGIRPRTCSSSRASWPTTWPRSRRWRRPPGSAPSSSASWRPHPAATGWPTPRPSAPAGGWRASTASSFLPNYGVFDEQRWFVPGTEAPTLFGVAGAWVGVSICEDVWFDDGPVAHEGRAGADVVVNLNASPYNRGRRARAPGHAARAGGRGRLRHRLRQPGRRAGRAGLRRRLADRRGRRHAGRLGRPVRHRSGARRPAARAAAARRP